MMTIGLLRTIRGVEIICFPILSFLLLSQQGNSALFEVGSYCYLSRNG